MPGEQQPTEGGWLSRQVEDAQASIAYRHLQEITGLEFPLGTPQITDDHLKEAFQGFDVIVRPDFRDVHVRTSVTRIFSFDTAQSFPEQVHTIRYEQKQLAQDLRDMADALDLPKGRGTAADDHRAHLDAAHQFRLDQADRAIQNGDQ
jgi:hypothetical protein